MPLPAAIALAVAATAAVGALVEVAFLRWLRKPTVLRMVVITIGVSILLREGALFLWGEGVRSLPYFTGDEVSSVGILGARISPQVFWVLGTVALIVGVLEWFYRRTLLGWEMQACAANKDAAALCGVPVRRLVTLSFAMAAAIGALAGAVVSPITYTSYAAGGPLAIKGFTVAILGGLGNSGGAVAAGLALGRRRVLRGLGAPGRLQGRGHPLPAARRAGGPAERPLRERRGRPPEGVLGRAPPRLGPGGPPRRRRWWRCSSPRRPPARASTSPSSP